jgi:hypothetical protein
LSQPKILVHCEAFSKVLFRYISKYLGSFNINYNICKNAEIFTRFFFPQTPRNFCEGKIENLLEYFRIFNSFDMGFSKLIKLFTDMCWRCTCPSEKQNS